MAYRRSSRDLDDDLAYGDMPPNRWDRSRFERARYEQDIRFEQDREPRRTEIIVEDRRRGRGDDRLYYDEAPQPRFASRIRREIYDDGPGYQDQALQPYRPREEYERDVFIERRRTAAVPRPGLLRRQSSLDTFDRRPPARFVYESERREERSPPRVVREREIEITRRPEEIRVEVDVDRRRSLRADDQGFVRRPSAPRSVASPPPREQVRETEIIREEVITRNRARSDVRSRASGVRSRASSSSSSSAASVSVAERKIGKRGHTKLPKAQFSESAVRRLGIDWTEEGDVFVLSRALEKTTIDQLLEWSRDAPREPRVTTYRYEDEVLVSNKNGRFEEIRTEWINPPSVRAPSPARSTRVPPVAPVPPPAAAAAPAPAQVTETIRITEQSSGPGPMPTPPQVVINPPVQQAPPVYVQSQPQYYQPMVQPQQLVFQPRFERSRQEIEDDIRRLQFESEVVRLERGSVPVAAPLYLTQQPYYDYRPSDGPPTFKPRRRRSSSPAKKKEEKKGKSLLSHSSTNGLLTLAAEKKPNPKFVSAMLATLT